VNKRRTLAEYHITAVWVFGPKQPEPLTRSVSNM
jgi:hypothetical protein